MYSLIINNKNIALIKASTIESNTSIQLFN